jgi:ArsR family metal-binding transcriptional regulator
MFLDSIALTRTHACMAEPGRIVVVGKPSHPLDDVLPYLAMLPNVITFDPAGHMLMLRRDRGWITLLSREVQITNVADVAEGLQLFAALVDAINATWANRQALVATTGHRRAARPLDVWSLLPQTNCGQCGEATCMAFAFALLQNGRSLAECPPLATDAAYTTRRAALEAML